MRGRDQARGDQAAGDDAPVDSSSASRGEGAVARTVEAADRPVHDVVQRFWLVVVKGPDAGATFTSAGERAVVGTHESADFVLHDETVSRFHCEIDRSGGAALTRDLGSRNGTRIDGVQIQAGYLRDGATLALGHTELRFELRNDPVKIPLSERDRFGTMVGRSVAMRRVFALLERAAESDATVLLEGETGTGKEVAAESIHQESARREGPFIIVDCGAIPPDLLESELFGHEKGAFTGAAAAREGAFEAASGREDLPLLVDNVLESLCAADRPEGAALRTPEFLADLARHRWSGNVRELRNYLERCLALREAVPLGGAAEGDSVTGPAFDQPLKVAREQWTRVFERRYVEEMLRRHDGKVAAAARAAGVDRMHFYRLLWRYGLK